MSSYKITSPKRYSFLVKYSVESQISSYKNMVKTAIHCHGADLPHDLEHLSAGTLIVQWSMLSYPAPTLGLRGRRQAVRRRGAHTLGTQDGAGGATGESNVKKVRGRHKNMLFEPRPDRNLARAATGHGLAIRECVVRSLRIGTISRGEGVHHDATGQVAARAGLLLCDGAARGSPAAGAALLRQGRGLRADHYSRVEPNKESCLELNDRLR
ncbi:hypothetical protein EVAR_11842_1 [Eumeta japonica]|uniref:Uncharacterized protein n=1 Tax=Eumeta variegata TaxID=151549 RepID=A0A4C1YQV8_EUMVA|nr:hypothetical protein EVAR_11842_1 [Eumeta japonica]